MDFEFSNSKVKYNIGGERDAEAASFAADLYKNFGVENVIYITDVIIAKDDSRQKVVEAFCNGFKDYVIVWCVGEKGLKGVKALQAQFLNRIIAESEGFADLSFYDTGDEDLRYMLFMNKQGSALFEKLEAFSTVFHLHDALLSEAGSEILKKELSGRPDIVKRLQQVLNDSKKLKTAKSF